MKNIIQFGDCFEIMCQWPAGFVQTCITSPPYFGLRDYGHPEQLGLENTVEDYIAALIKVFREVRRVLRDSGTLWLNIGDSYAGSSKRRNVEQSYQGGCKQVSNKGAALGSFVKTKAPGCKPKDLIGIPWMLAFALRADGWYLRQDIIWHKLNPMPESVRDRCTRAHEYIFLLSKSKHYFFNNEAIKKKCKEDWGARDRTNSKYRNGGTGFQSHSGLEKSYDKANKRSVWSVSTQPYKGAHFATFPPMLIEPCILAGSQLGDIVLDPFMGSGTTAAVALQNGRYYLGCELNRDYAVLQEERIQKAASLLVADLL